ncbi:MAG: response regulator, partial [Leptospiraceae bacterium]|nr:response regulator [Leptospiraceae bacterium]
MIGMRNRRFRYLYLPLVVLALAGIIRCNSNQGPAAVAGTLDLRGQERLLESGVLDLDGQWDFAWRQFTQSDQTGPPADAPDYGAGSKAEYEVESIVVDSPNRRLFQSVDVPKSWSAYEIDGRHLPLYGFGTYRLRVLVDRPVDNLALRGTIGSAFRIYVNGRLVHSAGRATVNGNEFRPDMTSALSEPFVLQPETEIVVEVANFDYFRSGIYHSLEFGNHELLARKKKLLAWVDIFLTGSLFFVSLYHLILFGLDRREISALYFVIMCIGISTRIMLVDERFLLDLLPPIPFNLTNQVLFAGSYILIPASTLFIHALFPDPESNWFVKTILGLSAVQLLAIFILNQQWLGYTIPVFGGLILLAAIDGITTMLRALRKKRPGALTFLIAFLCLLVPSLNDFLYVMQIVNTGYYVTYGFAAFVLVQAATVSNRLIRGRQNSEKLTADLEASIRRLRSLDQLKDDFLATTSHELRTPLQGIIGMATSLRDATEEPLSESSRRQLELIAISGRRLSGLVNDILEFTRLRNQDIRLHPVAIDLRLLIDLQLELIRFGMERDHKIELYNVVPTDFPPVYADESRITQILQNLLGNAVKYTAQGEIRIGAMVRPGGFAEVYIQDTGSGIAPDDQERIFQPFEQGRTDINRKPGSTGLGLSIAQSLVELHGGRLWLADSSSRGSRFHFTMPLQRPDGTPQLTEIDSSAISSTQGLQAIFRTDSAFDVRQNHNEIDSEVQAGVLLVDDESINIEVMRNYLGTVDIHAEFVNSAEAAREHLSAEHLPECVVLDIMLPGISGLELARELREKYDLDELPILMVTARTRTTDLMAALQAGANDYLIRPFEREEFISRVNNLVSLARSRKDATRSKLALRDAVRQERARINADLHDHLGASLTDLQLFSDAAVENPELDRNFTLRLRNMVTSAVQLLRGDLLSLEDLEMLEENFLDGMQLILLRRYVEA